MSSLNALLFSPSKQHLRKVLQAAFLFRTEPNPNLPDDLMIDMIDNSEEKLDEDSVSRCFTDLQSLIERCLYLNDVEAGFRGFEYEQNGDINERLKGLLMKAIDNLLPTWREASKNTRISLPKLVDMDWRVDIKSSTPQINNMSIPTCLVDLQVQNQPTQVGMIPDIDHVTFELSEEALGTMLEGLGRIRDQISTVATNN